MIVDHSSYDAMKAAITAAFEALDRPVPETEVRQSPLRLIVGDYQLWRDDHHWVLGYVTGSGAVEVMCIGERVDHVARSLVHHFDVWKRPSPDTPSRFVIEGSLPRKNIDVEDGGQAMVGEVIDGVEEGFFVRLHSWSEKLDHPVMQKLAGKRLRITVEVIE